MISVPGFDRARAWLRAVVQRRTLDREMREEMETHLARAAERLVARGLTPSQAREAARREFGNVAVHQEDARDARGARWIESIVADVRFALRHFARKPLAAATIVAVLALGIGVHSAAFALLQALTSRPAPGVPRDDALVRLRGKERLTAGGAWYGRPFSFLEVQDLAARRDLFSSVTGWITEPVTLDDNASESGNYAQAQFVADDFFATIQVRPQLGTALPRAGRDDAELPAVISAGLWNARFGGAPAAIGTTIHVNDTPVRIVGVAPQGFNGATPSADDRILWLPLDGRSRVLHAGGQFLRSPDSTLLSVVARLAPGATIAQATPIVRVMSARAVGRMTPRAGASDGDRDADVVALRGNTELPDDGPGLLGVLALEIAAMLILIVACTNVSALMIGAAVARRQEIAVRLSLGASRARIVRQLLTESCLLAIFGGALGLAIYWVLTRVLATRFPDLALAPDLATAGFTLMMALGTGILFGLSPALHATRSGTSEVLKGAGAGATRRSRLQSAFVVTQIAVTQPLLVTVAALLTLGVLDRGMGLDDDIMNHVIRLRLSPSDQSDGRTGRVRRAMDDLRSTPGVTGVASEATGSGIVNLTAISDGQRKDSLAPGASDVHLESTGPGYFKLLDNPIVRGRDLSDDDVAQRDRAIIMDSELARQLWGGADPIGRRVRQSSRGRALDRDLVVVGVFDAKRATTRGVGRRVYAINEPGRVGSAILVRTAGPAASIVRAVRAQFRLSAPGVPLTVVETLADDAKGDRREALQLSGGAAAGGALALLLASIGLYGVVALGVAQRRREIGIRVAIGARPRAVVNMLFWSGARLSVLGLAIGLPLSVACLNLLPGELLNILPPRTAIGAGIALAMLGVASLATWLPARRAAKVDPMIALRVE